MIRNTTVIVPATCDRYLWTRAARENETISPTPPRNPEMESKMSYFTGSVRVFGVLAAARSDLHRPGVEM